jgi:hypothetical protein
LPIDLSKVDVFVGGLLGVMLVFLFSSLAIRAVGNAAGAIIEEVRRQFRNDPGILAGTSRPDYAAAVDITAKAALRQMVLPGILAVGMPVAVGLIFRLRATGVVVAGVTYRMPRDGRGCGRSSRHDRRHPPGDRAQQRRRRLGQRQEVHRGRRTARRARRRPGEGQ